MLQACSGSRQISELPTSRSRVLFLQTETIHLRDDVLYRNRSSSSMTCNTRNRKASAVGILVAHTCQNPSLSGCHHGIKTDPILRRKAQQYENREPEREGFEHFRLLLKPYD